MSEIINWNNARAELAAQELDVLARTLWGEARGEGQRGMEAVANVILNRVAHARARPNGNFWWGNSVLRVCLKPQQFSCWNWDDPNRAKMLALTLSDDAFVIALRIAKWALSGALPDATGGADHYHALSVSPKWALGKTPTAVIGRHVFYRLERGDGRGEKQQ